MIYGNANQILTNIGNIINMKIRKFRYNIDILDAPIGRTAEFNVVNTHTVTDVLDVLQRDNPHSIIERATHMEDSPNSVCYTYIRDDEKWFVYIDIIDT